MLVDEYRAATLMLSARMGLDPTGREILSDLFASDKLTGDGTDSVAGITEIITQSGLDGTNQVIMAYAIRRYSTNSSVEHAMVNIINGKLQELDLETEAGRNILPYAVRTSIHTCEIEPNVLADLISRKIVRARLSDHAKYELTDMTLNHTKAGHPLREALVDILNTLLARTDGKTFDLAGGPA